MKVGFIGVGKLGQPCAEAMAEHYNVLGYDISERTPKNFRMASTLKRACLDRDIIFIAAPTPHDPSYDGRTPIVDKEPKDFDYSAVIELLKELDTILTKDQLVVLISTVLPGTTRNQFAPLCNNFRFIYNPYLIAMGSVQWDMLNPEMIIIGTQDGEETGDAKILKDFYAPMMQNNPKIVVGTWDEAESIKIFYNTFISAKVGLVNMIQDVAQKNGNINVDVVTEALAGATMRITGPKYLKAGMGDAGPCHPRDNIALRYLADRLDLEYDLFYAIMKAREVQAENLAKELVFRAVNMNTDTVYIHGKAYKPGVEYIDGSYSLLVGYYVEQHGKQVVYIDPLTGDNNKMSAPGVILLAHSATTTYGYTDMAVTDAFYCEIPRGSTVVDPWRTFADKGYNIIHYGNTRH